MWDKAKSNVTGRQKERNIEGQKDRHSDKHLDRRTYIGEHYVGSQ